ncbi:MAG: DUF3800 domain-containing protein [Bdellovibrionales bacterium]|nr:DUF3800 domain-containing protein [Bdellovibrionales bacterium]
MKNTIFFDEAGNTGPNLLDQNSSVFTMASVDMEENEASAILDDFKQLYPFQGAELKGKNYVGRTIKNREINFLLDKLENKYALTLCYKHYFLCIYMFEYLLEPIVSGFNSILYATEFNKFFVNQLYVDVVADKEAREFSEIFFKMMKSNSPTQFLDAVIDKGLSIQTVDSPCHQLAELANSDRAALIAELNSIEQNSNILRWAMDPTITSFFGHISYWGQKKSEINIVYDQSKQVSDFKESYNSMVNGQPTLIDLGLKQIPIGAKLGSEICEKDSKDSCGIQLADFVASITRWAFESFSHPDSINIRSKLAKHFIDNVIVPKAETYNPELPENKPLFAMLVHMVECVRSGQQVTNDVGQIYYLAKMAVENGEI